jgi:hypothetical protein
MRKQATGAHPEWGGHWYLISIKLTPHGTLASPCPVRRGPNIAPACRAESRARASRSKGKQPDEHQDWPAHHRAGFHHHRRGLAGRHRRGCRGGHQGLGIQQQQRVLRRDVPRRAPRGDRRTRQERPCARQLRRMPHGAQFHAAPDGAQADPLQGAVGHDRGLRAAPHVRHLAPFARSLRKLPLPDRRAPRQHRGEGQLRHRRRQQRDPHQARAAHRHGRHPPRLHPRHPLAYPERGAFCLAGPAAARDPLGGGDQA